MNKLNMIKTEEIIFYGVIPIIIMIAVTPAFPQLKNLFIGIGTVIIISIMFFAFFKWKKSSQKLNKQPNKIMLYKEYIEKTEQQPCPKCGLPMKFHSNIETSNLAYRKEHDDALFKCKPCKENYVILDYKTKNN